MRFYCISDNVDTQVGLRLVGIEGQVVHKRREFLELLETKLKDDSIGIILITTNLIELAPDVISEIKLKQQKPLLVEIPDRHGESKIGETIDKYVSEAIGVKLQKGNAMEKKEQVFLYMKEEIERLANLEEEKILDEAKRLEEEAYNQIKAEAKKDAEALLAKELVEISSNASVEASSSQEEKTKKLVEKRDEYVANIFSEAKDKLVAFANSKDYQAYLVKHMEEIGKLYPMSDSTLELREADMKYKDELIKAYGTALEVEVSDKITIGGFIVKNKATNVVVDESLDFALENQKDWFYKTSGLMIK